MNNVASSAVKVFPLSKNRPTDRSSRLFYEDNVTNMITQVVDTEGFIISPSLSEELGKSYPYDAKDYFQLRKDTTTGKYFLCLSAKHSLVFNLGGYRFELIADSTLVDLVNIGKPGEEGFTVSTDGMGPEMALYAYICIDKEYKEISGQDYQNKYTGLYLTTNLSEISTASSHPDYTAVYSLQLIKFKPRKSTVEADLYVIADDSPTPENTGPVFVSSSFVKYSTDSIDLSIDTIDGTREIVVS